MKHATPAALNRLETLLSRLRKIPGLTEKSRGVFYRSGRAFLHFHEDGEMFFADVRFEDEFERLPATSPSQRAVVLKRVMSAMKKNAERTG